LGQKQFFVLKKNMDIVKTDANKTKRLVRMRSDFAGLPPASELLPGKKDSPTLSGKVR
jgi:hypothetical protein